VADGGHATRAGQEPDELQSERRPELRGLLLRDLVFRLHGAPRGLDGEHLRRRRRHQRAQPQHDRRQLLDGHGGDVGGIGQGDHGLIHSGFRESHLVSHLVIPPA
jgi:hypothetical protein